MIWWIIYIVGFVLMGQFITSRIKSGHIELSDASREYFGVTAFIGVLIALAWPLILTIAILMAIFQTIKEKLS